METSSLRIPDISSFRSPTYRIVRMLPFPIFLFLLVSATLLAPPPPVLVGSFKIFTLRSFEWTSLYTSIPDPDPGPQSPPENTALFSFVPSVTLNPLPTQSCPNSMLAANNTVSHLFVRATDGRTSSIAVLLVVSLATLSCLVYRLLVDESDESHDAERKLKQFTQFPFSNSTTPPRESVHLCIPTVEEKPRLFLSVDTTKPVSESLEHGSLPYSIKSPSTPSSATTIPHQSPAPLGQPLLFPVISHGSSPDSDCSPSTLPASVCALMDPPSVSATQTAAFEAPNTLSVDPAFRIDDSEVGLPECTPLDTEAAKVTTLPLLDPSNVSHPRNPEPSGEMRDGSVSCPAIEDGCELDADEQDVFCYIPSKSEDVGGEKLDFLDSTPEAPKTPPAPATEDRALPSLQFRLRARSHSLDYASSFSAKKAASEVVNAHLPSPRFSFLPGRTSEGEGEITFITRCASADDLVTAFKTSNAAHAPIITNCPSPTIRCDISDDSVQNQVTTLSSLRVDAPIFKPRSPGMNEVVSLKSVSVLNATTNSSERPIESSNFQTSIDAVEEPESPLNAQPTKSASPRVTVGLRASIHAPSGPSTGTLQVLGDDTENSKEPTHTMPRSNSTRRGLYASIHAPVAGRSGQSAQRSSERHSDMPNWAAICRAEKSSTEGSHPAKCAGNSPDSAAALDEGVSVELPTTTRCAAGDQEGSSVDESDGSSLVHADDREDTTISSGEADSAPGPDEHDSTGTKPPRKSRRRGGRRSRRKIPYVPPPRMQNLLETQNPVIDIPARGLGQTPDGLAAPASLSGHQHHYVHAPPAPPHHPTPAPGLMIPPNGIIHDQFGRPYPHYYPNSPHLAPIPGFQPPVPHSPSFYPLGPYPHVPPHAPPSALLYGR